MNKNTGYWSQHLIWMLVQVLDALLPIQLSAMALESNRRRPESSGPAPTWETWLQIGIALAILEVNQRMKDLSLSLSLFLSLSV